MSRRRKTLGFDPSRLRLDAREEIRVGAYVRRQRRQRILIGVLGAALIAGAFGLYRQLRPPGGANAAGRYPAGVRCTACGHAATVYVPFGQSFPMECPACRQTASAALLWKCLNCGERFAPREVENLVRCPKCRSARVGSAAAP